MSFVVHVAHAPKDPDLADVRLCSQVELVWGRAGGVGSRQRPVVDDVREANRIQEELVR